jgi:hypothetical protein
MSTRKEQKEQARARRLELEAALREQARRKRHRLFGISAMVATTAVLVIVIVATGSASNRTGPSSQPPARDLAPLVSLGQLRSPGSLGAVGPEGVPVPSASDLANGSRKATGTPVDGIQCQGSEQILFHIHAHLTVYVNGAARQVPYGIGIPGAQVSGTPVGPYVAAGSCFYWLHTHAADGIIHIESPVVRTYTLGDFFDIWGQKLSPTQVGPAIGAVTALYNGRVFRGDPRNVPLTKHAQIQLDVGRPLVAPAMIRFPPGL